MLQNICIAAMPRTPRAFGLNLEYEGFCLKPKVMGSLMETEIKFARAFGKETVGRSLVNTFLPDLNQLRRSEQRWRDLALDDKEILFNKDFWSIREEEEQTKMLDELETTNHNVHG